LNPRPVVISPVNPPSYFFQKENIEKVAISRHIANITHSLHIAKYQALLALSAINRRLAKEENSSSYVPFGGIGLAKASTGRWAFYHGAKSICRGYALQGHLKQFFPESRGKHFILLLQKDL